MAIVWQTDLPRMGGQGRLSWAQGGEGGIPWSPQWLHAMRHRLQGGCFVYASAVAQHSPRRLHRPTGVGGPTNLRRWAARMALSFSFPLGSWRVSPGSLGGGGSRRGAAFVCGVGARSGRGGWPLDARRRRLAAAGRGAIGTARPRWPWKSISGRKASERLHRPLEAERPWRDAVFGGGLGHHGPDQVVRQQVGPDFFTHQLGASCNATRPSASSF